MKSLIKPQTLIAFWLYGVFGWLCIKGVIKPEALIAVVASLMTFYYTEKIRNNKKDKSINDDHQK